MFTRTSISFRPLKQDHLSLMYRWLRNSNVSRWYGTAPDTLAEVEAKYLPRMSGDVPVNGFVAEYESRPVAYVQWYFIASEPEYAAALDVDPGAVGVDVFIGEADFRHHGFGPVMLQEFVARLVFPTEGVSCCVISPTISNTSAIRAYEKAGFRHLKTVSVPNETEPEYVMIMWPIELIEAVKRLDEECVD